MALRRDVIYMSKIHWEPKVPNESVILEQGMHQIKHGKSTGNIHFDIQVFNALFHSQKQINKVKKLTKTR